MASAPVPKARALETVAPLVPEIYRAFEHGTAKASAYFQTENLQRDPHLEAMIVKAHGLDHLRKSSDFSEVAFDRLAMCGISFRYNNWQFRLWKSADRYDAKIPSPGQSNKKQEYFVQPEQIDLFEHSKERPTISGPELHLIILWNLDGLGNLEKLWLVCPESYNQQTGEIKVHWVAELPNPLSEIQAPATPAPVPELQMKPREQKKAKEK